MREVKREGEVERERRDGCLETGRCRETERERWRGRREWCTERGRCREIERCREREREWGREVEREGM